MTSKFAYNSIRFMLAYTVLIQIHFHMNINQHCKCRLKPEQHSCLASGWWTSSKVIKLFLRCGEEYHRKPKGGQVGLNSPGSEFKVTAIVDALCEAASARGSQLSDQRSRPATEFDLVQQLRRSRYAANAPRLTA